MTSELLGAHLADRLAVAGVRGARRLPGGFSSLTYLGEIDGAPVVVKVGPAGRAPTGHRDVLRQARILDVLRPVAGVPVPRVVLRDLGDPPAVPPLFVMTFVEGDCVEPLSDDGRDLPSATTVTSRADGLTRALAALHRPTTEHLDLAAEPVVGLEQEVLRWSAVFAASGRPPSAALLGERLCATAPPPLRPAVVHGDFRLGNALCDGPDVVAVIDWEIWSVGDPRTDLAWLLLRAAPAQLHTAQRAAPGMPTKDELQTLYEDGVGEPVIDLAWFAALARYKYAAIVSGLVRRPPSRGTEATLAAKAEAVPALLMDVERLLQEIPC